MKRNTMIKVLRACAIGSGVGQEMTFMLSQVVFLSGVPRMTTYRYLKIAEELGFVEITKSMYRGNEISRYSTTKAGRDFAGVI